MLLPACMSLGNSEGVAVYALRDIPRGRRVVFHKTCTLTEGLMSLSDVVADENEARFLT